MRRRKCSQWVPAATGIAALLVAGGILGHGDALAKRARRPSVKGQLRATAANPSAEGNFEENVEDGLPDGNVEDGLPDGSSGGAQGTLKVKARKLAPQSTYSVNVGGVPIGALQTNASGRGRAKFSSTPRRRTQPLTVDPRGKQISVTDGSGETTLEGEISDPTTPGGIQCCLNTHDASGDQEGCDSLLEADCAAAGGVSMGPGSCEPDPCPSTGPGDSASGSDAGETNGGTDGETNG